jgi:hypothetical protein
MAEVDGGPRELLASSVYPGCDAPSFAYNTLFVEAESPSPIPIYRGVWRAMQDISTAPSCPSLIYIHTQENRAILLSMIFIYPNHNSPITEAPTFGVSSVSTKRNIATTIKKAKNQPSHHRTSTTGSILGQLIENLVD